LRADIRPHRVRARTGEGLTNLLMSYGVHVINSEPRAWPSFRKAPTAPRDRLSGTRKTSLTSFCHIKLVCIAARQAGATDLSPLCPMAEQKAEDLGVSFAVVRRADCPPARRALISIDKPVKTGTAEAGA
jgi:hypothetical protein